MTQGKGHLKTTVVKRYVTICLIVFVVLFLCLTVGMNIMSTAQQQEFLHKSVKAELVSISLAAREQLDVEALAHYTSKTDVARDQENFDRVLSNLRSLQKTVDAQYIYVLRMIDGEAVFVFDTDQEHTEIFDAYALSPVHEQAFAGENAAGVLNVQDEWGSYNTGAVPIWYEEEIIGIISTDLEDTFVRESQRAGIRNDIILLIALLVVSGVVIFVVWRLMKRLHAVQQELIRMAHYDVVTGLPNRQYLMDYLERLTSGQNTPPFALLFIDLDNFKSVNDNAGHDAGDELLNHIAKYLQSALEGSMSFRPEPGRLNIAARIGGDEFVQVLTGVENEAQAEKQAGKLLQGFSGPGLDKYIQKYQVGLSIGVALYPYHTSNYHVLIKYADIAMYHAKHSGKNQYRIYADEMKGKDEK